jgi:hypothetical protein
MPKRGLSLVPFERYLLVFPTVCSEIDAYKESLPVVLQALSEPWGPRFPRQFIHASCGTMFPRLVDVAEYLTGAEKVHPKAVHR